MLQNSKYPDAFTHRDLKERLYYEIIGYFDKGKVSAEVCKSPASMYTSENVFVKQKWRLFLFGPWGERGGGTFSPA